ncbi:hypothetical protein N9B72_00475 [Bacteriovoracaceae bacterium]|nr:hypothetical protein [Bacteriovoracaceae bacterium]
MIKQIFLFSNVKFFSDSITHALKKQGVETFLILEDQELEYFIQDYTPQALVLDLEGCTDSTKIMLRIGSLAEKLPVIILCKSDQELNSCLRINKPIDPFELLEQLNEKVTVGNK